MDQDSTPGSASWNGETLASLMDYIVTRHHSFCRQEVAKLRALFHAAIASHGKDRPELKRMAALFHSLARDLEMHLVKEEQTLFPYIASVEETVSQQGKASWPRFGSVENPIQMMLLEHDQTGRELKELRRLGNQYALPADAASEDYRALYDGLKALELDMMDHVHAEDNLLFPRAIAMEAEACSRQKPAGD
jgi:regulator of cell morphogenesis and NO signaling